jgi:hypothetical protein
MAQKIGVVSIPASFETLRDAVGPDRIGQLLLECPDDLEAIKKALAEVTAAGQGKLSPCEPGSAVLHSTETGLLPPRRRTEPRRSKFVPAPNVSGLV